MIQKKSPFFFLLFLTLPFLTYSQIKAYPIDAWHSRVGFAVKFGGLIDVTGRFNSFKGTILFNKKDLSKTSATIIIDASSVNTGLGMRDNHLKRDDFLDVEKFPQMIFTSDKVVKDGAGQFNMIGQLELHGVVKELSIPFELIHAEESDSWKNFRISFKGAINIKRSDFGMEYDKAISDEVRIDLMISARILNMGSIALFNRPLGSEMMTAIEEEGVPAGIEKYTELKKQGDKDANKISSLNFIYLKLDQSGRQKEALEIAKFFVKEYPEEAYAHSLLAWTLYKIDKTKEARYFTEKALELDAQEPLAMEMNKVLPK